MPVFHPKICLHLSAFEGRIQFDLCGGGTMISLKEKEEKKSCIMLLVKCHFQHSVTEESCEEKHSQGCKAKLPS